MSHATHTLGQLNRPVNAPDQDPGGAEHESEDEEVHTAAFDCLVAGVRGVLARAPEEVQSKGAEDDHRSADSKRQSLKS